MRVVFRGMFVVCCLLLTMTLAASQAGAQFISGSGLLEGKDKIAVQRCGRDPGIITAAVMMSSDGGWSASVEGLGYTGSYGPKGASGRKFDLFFDGASELQFVTALEGFAADLCGVSVTATSAERKKFTLKLNRKRTKAVVLLKYRFEGTGDGRSGRAKYTFKLKGPWAN